METLDDATVSEFDRIARLSRAFPRVAPPSLGIGDDAAVLVGDGPLVVTVDACVEGVHFRPTFADWATIAARAVEAAASDIAAMGARLDVPGAAITLAWTLPRDFSEAAFDGLVEGAATAASRMKTYVVGGNLASAPLVTLTTTVLGRATTQPLTRHGARVGDCIAVTGNPGLRALGLQALLQHREDETALRPAVEAWRRPHARLDEGLALAGRATACIDLSDGLVQDAGHLAAASSVALHLDLDRLPRTEAMKAAAWALGVSLDEAILAGGEDYELFATGPREAFDARWTLLGEVVAGSGVYLRDAHGLRPLSAQGWDHFRV